MPGTTPHPAVYQAMSMFGHRLRPVGLALLLVVLSAASPLAPAAMQRLRAQPRTLAPAIPDTLLLAQWPGPSRSPRQFLTLRRLAVLEPTSLTPRPLLDGAQQPVVSPDGRELYFVRNQEMGDAVRVDLVALASDSLASRWTAHVATLSAAALEQPDGASLSNLAIAATDGSVYVGRLSGPSAPLEIVVLDRADGAERARWQVDLGRSAAGANLFADADGGYLDVLAVDSGAFGPTGGPPLTMVRLRRADGVEVARFRPPQAADAGAFVWNGIPVPGGRALYKLSPDEDPTTTSVEFLDLATGSVERLDVGLAIPREVQFAPREWGASPDGARLYVLSPLSGELAIIDLVQRRVLQKVSLGIPAPPRATGSPLADLWTNVRGLLAVSGVDAKVPFSQRLEVSPDGRRLYGVAARSERDGLRGDGVWAIDVQQWQVAAHWLAGSEPFTLLLSADGQRLYAHDAQTGRSPGALHVLDTASGVEAATVDGLGTGQVFSVAGLYRERYGHAARPLQVAADLKPTPVAGITVSASPSAALAGDALGVEVRFVDPGTGRTLVPDQSDVPFAPPARVFAVVSQGADPDRGLTLELALVEYAVYRGSLAAPAPTNWSHGTFTLQAIAEWPDGLRRRTLLQDAVVVQPAFAGSDGRRYLLRVSSEPTQPVVDQPARVAIEVVDAETGAALPDGVTLFGGLPPFVDATLYADRSGGVMVRRLQPVGPGAYAGRVSLFSPGPWRVLVSFGPPVSETFAVGTLAVTTR
jgi:hypothetical protein